MSVKTTTRRLNWRHRLSREDVKVAPHLYISLFFIVFAVTGLFPLLYTAWVSLHKWHLIGGNQGFNGFNGFDNYIAVLQHPVFWVALRNTFSIFLLSSMPQIILAIFIAWMLDANLRAKTFWLMGVLPYVVTVPRNLEHTAMGWEVNADDLFLLLTRLSDEYTSKTGIP